ITPSKGGFTLHDYEHTLHYLMWKKWDELFMIMIRTKDDFLELKIHYFLHAYYYTTEKHDILDKHKKLLAYINHALHQQYKEEPVIRITDALFHNNNQSE